MERRTRSTTTMTGKWFLLKALAGIAILVLAGVALEDAWRSIRLRSGPHAYFVVSSRYGYVTGGRGGGKAWQIDSIVAGPLKTSALCKAELAHWESGYGLSVYCRDLLFSDAAAMRSRIIIPQSAP